MRTLIAAILIIHAFNVSAGDNRYQNRYNYQPQVIQLDPVRFRNAPASIFHAKKRGR